MQDEELGIYVRNLLVEMKDLKARVEQLENKVNAQAGEIYTFHGENHQLKMHLSSLAANSEQMLNAIKEIDRFFPRG